MCRWMVYSGDPVSAGDLLFQPVHSLIDQSLHARQGATTTNGDGFGIGWYGDGGPPAVFKSVSPAWNDQNLREVAAHVRTPLLFAHVRASTGTPVQRSNCHPFRHGRWLWMHNGSVARFPEVKRDLVMAVEPSLFPSIEGSTDSETLFFLALTFGLADDPPEAVSRAVGLVEATGRRLGVPSHVQLAAAVSDGETVWVFRYATSGTPRSLYYSTDIAQLRKVHTDLEQLRTLGDDARFVVSEPLRDLEGAWNRIPEGAYGVVRPGGQTVLPFPVGAGR